MGALTVLGSAVGAYVMSMAVLSPCPLLVAEGAGGGGLVVSITCMFEVRLKVRKSFMTPSPPHRCSPGQPLFLLCLMSK